jgi:ribonuclease Z
MSRRLFVLGSGTALPSAERDNTSLAVESGNGLWLVDCSGSVYRRLLRLGLDPMRLRGLFLTHSHPDHIYGLPALLFHLKLAGWHEEGPALHVYGNGPTLTLVRDVLAAYQIDLWQPPLAWHELPASENHRFLESEGLIWTSTAVVHSRPTLAVRIAVESSGYAVVYSADTGPCESLVQLALGADSLFHECTTVTPMPEGHSTPEQVGEVAARARVGRLVIVHYDPRYILPTDETLTLIRKGGYMGQVAFAEDGSVWPLQPA